jgi:hypothetical protein
MMALSDVISGTFRSCARATYSQSYAEHSDCSTSVRGKNKQKRNDCPQVAVGIAFNEHGLALAHEVFEGNISDASTLLQMLDRLGGAAVANAKPVVILDAGIATEANLSLLKEKGYSYLVNVTRGSRTQYAEAFRGNDFEPLPGRDEDKKVEVKSIAHPEAPDDRLVLCRSSKRRDKEQAMLSNAEKRFLADVEKLRQRVSLGRLKDKDKILKAIGRVLAKHPRAARFYQIELAEADICVQRKDTAIQKAYELCGDYVLRRMTRSDGTRYSWRASWFSAAFKQRSTAQAVQLPTSQIASQNIPKLGTPENHRYPMCILRQNMLSQRCHLPWNPEIGDRVDIHDDHRRPSLLNAANSFSVR